MRKQGPHYTAGLARVLNLGEKCVITLEVLMGDRLLCTQMAVSGSRSREWTKDLACLQQVSCEICQEFFE